MAWQKNGTPNTLGSAGDTLTISDMTGLQFNQILCHVLDDGSVIDKDFRIDNISTTTYSYRESDDGTADVVHNGTGSGENEITLDDTSAATERFTVGVGINISGDEKLFIFHTVDANTAGAGTAPSRVETVGKQVGTSSRYTRIDVLNTQAGSFDTNSNLSAFGTD